MKGKVKIEKSKIRLKGKKVYLRSLIVSDVTQEYINWLNDEEVNQFLEARFSRHTQASVETYVKKLFEDPNTILLGIFPQGGKKHIGNIKLGPMNWNHKRGEIGIMIGDKGSWGKGFATEAIALLTNYAFDVLKLHKVTAGAYEKNIGSIKAFLKLGFFEEGRQKKHVFYKGTYIDRILVAKINT